MSGPSRQRLTGGMSIQQRHSITDTFRYAQRGANVYNVQSLASFGMQLQKSRAQVQRRDGRINGALQKTRPALVSTIQGNSDQLLREDRPLIMALIPC